MSISKLKWYKNVFNVCNKDKIFTFANMQLLRYIVFPFTPIYYIATWVRNKLYDKGIKSSKTYDFPLISVGNLSTGGTGKSPMVEYLVRLLKTDYQMATLSRGYGRQTKGYVLGNSNSSALTLGDEPFQFYYKYGDTITVSVCEDRQTGIANLINAKTKPDIILLDDAYQHRKVSAGLNILLTTYSNLYTEDWVLPIGNLREPRSGAQRAQLIVVTKCPIGLADEEKELIKHKIKPLVGQELFFSTINYPETVIGLNDSMSLRTLSNFILVTGIANAKPLVSFLKSKHLNFKHTAYKDHYHFTEKEAIQLNKNELIVTTEKDFMRLKSFKLLKDKLYYLPIEIAISDAERFNSIIKDFVIKTL